jgi:hypothetical protein
MRSLQGLLHFYLRWQTIQRKHATNTKNCFSLHRPIPANSDVSPAAAEKKKPREVESQSKNCDNKGGKNFVQSNACGVGGGAHLRVRLRSNESVHSLDTVKR